MSSTELLNNRTDQDSPTEEYVPAPLTDISQPEMLITSQHSEAPPHPTPLMRANLSTHVQIVQLEFDLVEAQIRATMAELNRRLNQD
jgi:hypothetical protein